MEGENRKEPKKLDKKLIFVVLTAIVLLVLLILFLQRCGKASGPGPENVSQISSGERVSSKGEGNASSSSDESLSSAQGTSSTSSQKNDASSSLDTSHGTNSIQGGDPAASRTQGSNGASATESSSTSQSSSSPSESQVSEPEIREYKQLPSSCTVSGKSGTEGVLLIVLSRYPLNNTYQSIEGVLALPKGIEVTKVVAGGGVYDGTFDWNVDETGVLRFAYLTKDAGSMQFEQSPGKKNLVTIYFTLTEDQKANSLWLDTQRITAKSSGDSLAYQVNGKLAGIYFQ